MNDHPHEPNDTLPAELVDALRALDGPPAAPSAEHDAALLAGAREHLAGIGIHRAERRGRSRYVLAFIGGGGAVAAAAAVTFAVVFTQNDAKHDAAPALAHNDTGNDSPRPTDAGRPPYGLTQEPDAPAARQPHGEPVPGDLDRSGTVDILDAFALARAVERGEANATDPTYDFNRDGTTDARDADWLAQRAVAVRRDGGQG